MSICDDLAFELYQIFKSYGKTIILYDDTGREVFDPSQARRMFIKPEKMMLSLIDNGSDKDDNNNEMRLYLSSTTDIKDIVKLLSSLRQTSNRFNYVLSVKKYGRELSPRDFAMGTINESRMFGSDTTSYQMIGNVKLVIEHTQKIVDENTRGARSRKIDSIYVENTTTNERHRFPVNNLSAARAMCRHINEGGKFSDKIGNLVIDLAEELDAIKKVKKDSKKALKNNLTESSFLTKVIENSDSRLNEIRTTFAIISGAKNYHRYTDMFKNSNIFEYDNTSDMSLLSNALGENVDYIAPYASHILGERLSRFPIIEVENPQDLSTDLRCITRYKKGIDYSLNEHSVKFYNPSCFAEALSILSDTDTSYKLNLKEEEQQMSDYTVSVDVKDPELRDSLIDGISNDFSYSEGEDFGPVGTTKVGFSDEDTANGLLDYIHIYDPNAVVVQDTTSEPEDDTSSTTDEPSAETDSQEDDSSQESTEESTETPAVSGDEPEGVGATSSTDLEMQEEKELMDWIEEFDPNKFLGEAGMDVPEFGTIDNAIHNSPDLFNLNEFISLCRPEFIEPHEIINSINDYLFDRVLSKNPRLQSQHIEPDMFTSVSKGIYARLVLPKLKRDGSIEESKFDMLEAINEAINSFNVASFKSSNLMEDSEGDLGNKLVEYIIESVFESTGEMPSYNDVKDMISPYFGTLIPVIENTIVEAGTLRNKTDDPNDMSKSAQEKRKVHDVNPGARVTTYRGLATVVGFEKLKRKRDSITVVRVRYDDGEEEILPDKGVVPLSAASPYMGTKTGTNLNIQPDRTIDNQYESTILEEFGENQDDPYANGYDDVGEFFKSKYWKFVEERIIDGVVDDSLLVDGVLRFINANGLDDSDEGMQSLIDDVRHEARDQGLTVTDPGDDDIEEQTDELSSLQKMAGISTVHEEGDEVEGEESPIPGNFQTSFIDDVKSDKVFNPHQNKFGQVDDNNSDDMARLKALAGMGM